MKIVAWDSTLLAADILHADIIAIFGFAWDINERHWTRARIARRIRRAFEVFR